METIKLRLRLTPQDYLRSVGPRLRRSIGLSLLRIPLTIGAIYIGLISAMMLWNLNVSLFTLVGLVGSLIIIFPILACNLLATIQIRRNPGLLVDAMLHEFGEDGFTWYLPGLTSHAKWSHFTGWMRAKHHFLLVYRDNRFRVRIVPLSAFTSDADRTAFADLLTRKFGEEKRFFLL